VRAQLIVVVVMEAFDGCVFDRAIHPLDLAVGPRMVRFCQSVLDPARHCPRTNGGQFRALTDHVEAHRPRMDGVSVPGLLGELDAVASGRSDRWRNHWQLRENGVNLVGHGLKHVLQEFPGSASVCLFNELGYGELTRAVDADKEIERSSAVWTSAISMWKKPMG